MFVLANLSQSYKVIYSELFRYFEPRAEFSVLSRLFFRNDLARTMTYFQILWEAYRRCCELLHFIGQCIWILKAQNPLTVNHRARLFLYFLTAEYQHREILIIIRKLTFLQKSFKYCFEMYLKRNCMAPVTDVSDIEFFYSPERNFQAFLWWMKRIPVLARDPLIGHEGWHR